MCTAKEKKTYSHRAIVVCPPPPLVHAQPCLSRAWALNRRFVEILGPLFLWFRMEDWVFVEFLSRKRSLRIWDVFDGNQYVATI